MLTVFFVIFTNFLQKRWGTLEHHPGRLNPEFHHNSLIYTDGARQ